MTGYLVTGASGFIGRHLTAALLADGEKVFVLVRPEAEVEDLGSSGAQIFRGDFTREKDLEPIFQIGNIEIVFHLAAIMKEAGVSNQFFYEVNVAATRRLLELAKKYGVKRFVYVSTTGVLGDVEKIPADENEPCRATDIYQKTKAEAEKLVLEFGKNEGIEVVVARPGAVYGPGDKRFLKLFQLIKKHLFVMLGTGRNFIHPVYITDVVDGLKLCARVPGISGQIYHLAGSRYVTVNEFADNIAAAIGVKILPFKLPLGPVLFLSDIFEWLGKIFHFELPIFRRKMEFFVKNRAFAITAAIKGLGYTPKVGLVRGLELTVKWYREKKWL